VGARCGIGEIEPIAVIEAEIAKAERWENQLAGKADGKSISAMVKELLTGA